MKNGSKDPVAAFEAAEALLPMIVEELAMVEEALVKAEAGLSHCEDPECGVDSVEALEGWLRNINVIGGWLAGVSSDATGYILERHVLNESTENV